MSNTCILYGHGFMTEVSVFHMHVTLKNSKIYHFYIKKSDLSPFWKALVIMQELVNLKKYHSFIRIIQHLEKLCYSLDE